MSTGNAAGPAPTTISGRRASPSTSRAALPRARSPPPTSCCTCACTGSRRARRSPLLWIPDTLLVLRVGGLDWPRLFAQARRRRFVLRTATMLAYLSRSFAAPIPDEVLTRLQALPVSRLERFEYWVGNRPQGLLGELPSYWCNYRRLRGDGQVTSPLGFPQYLQQTWRLGSLSEVARGAPTAFPVSSAGSA